MNIDLANIKLVIFDLDGTLVNSDNREIPYFFERLSAIIETDIERDISKYPQRTFSSVLNLVSSNNQGLYDQLEHKMLEFVQGSTWFPLPLGVELLGQAIEQGIEYFIVTGNFKVPSIMKATLAGIKLPRDRVYCTELGSDSKALVIEKLIASRGCLPNQVLSIGDSQYDKDIADQLRLHFVWAES